MATSGAVAPDSPQWCLQKSQGPFGLTSWEGIQNLPLLQPLLSKSWDSSSPPHHLSLHSLLPVVPAACLPPWAQSSSSSFLHPPRPPLLPPPPPSLTAPDTRLVEVGVNPPRKCQGLGRGRFFYCSEAPPPELLQGTHSSSDSPLLNQMNLKAYLTSHLFHFTCYYHKLNFKKISSWRCFHIRKQPILILP